MNKYLLRVATDYGSVEKHSRKPVEGLRFRWCIAIAPNDILVCRLSEIPSGIIPWSTLEAIPHVLESDFVVSNSLCEVFDRDRMPCECFQIH